MGLLPEKLKCYLPFRHVPDVRMNAESHRSGIRFQKLISSYMVSRYYSTFSMITKMSNAITAPDKEVPITAQMYPALEFLKEVS